MPNGHTVMVGGEWVDGMLVGRAAALAEWSIRKEIDDPEFERLIDRLRQKRYWANLDSVTKSRIQKYRERWKQENRDQYRKIIRAAKRRGRKNQAPWYQNELVRKRENNAKVTQEMRKQVYTCLEDECGVKWCIAFGRIPPRRPKYCSTACRSRANYKRGKANGAPWAKRDKTSTRAGTCDCGLPTSRVGRLCIDCSTKIKT